MYVRQSEINEVLELTNHGVIIHPQAFSFQYNNYKVKVKFINNKYVVLVTPTTKTPSYFKRRLIKREVEKFLSEVYDV